MSRTEAGRVFQTRGPKMLNDRSPIAVRDLGTSSVGPRWQSACRSDADQCTLKIHAVERLIIFYDNNN